MPDFFSLTNALWRFCFWENATDPYNNKCDMKESIHKDFLRSSDQVKGGDPSYTQVLHNMWFRQSTDNSRRMPLTSSSNQLFACPLSLVSQAKHAQIMVNTRQ